MNRILAFDPQTGCHRSGGRHAALPTSSRYAAPHGFFPQVVPGTQFVTLGGAIANDVHGKNHHRRGTFGRHVEALHAAALGRQRSIAARRRATRASSRRRSAAWG